MTAANGSEYRIDDLAQAAGTTVRNVRAYQERGLLPPPRRVGRVGLYSDAHLARLRIIGGLLGRGFTVNNIGELVSAWEHGRDLPQVLGLEQVVSTFGSDELPTVADRADVEAAAGSPPDTAGLTDALVRLGIAEPHGTDQFRLPSPQLLHAVGDLVGAGLPAPSVVGLLDSLLHALDDTAAQLVGAVVTAVLNGRDDSWMPSATEIPELTALLGRVRPAIGTAVAAALGLAVERHTESALGEFATRIMPEAADRPHHGAGLVPSEHGTSTVGPTSGEETP